jgi:hypothetical protein
MSLARFLPDLPAFPLKNMNRLAMKTCRKRHIATGGKDDVRTYGKESIPRQLAPLVQLVHAVWQFFQGAGEEIRISVWAPQEQPVTAA